MSFGLNNIVSISALMLSGFATWKTFRFNERQKSLIESQEKLNKVLLERNTAEAREGKKADLGATFVKLGNSNYRLKIWNKGKATAYLLRIEFLEENDIVPEWQINEIFPFEALEQHQSVELIACVTMNTKPKHPIRISWVDEFASENQKVVYPTL